MFGGKILKNKPDGVSFDTLGKRLKWARVNAGYSQRSLANLLGHSSQQHISGIESGRIEQPEKDLLIKMARILNVDPAWLAFGREEIGELGKEALEFAMAFQRMNEGQVKDLIRREISRALQEQAVAENSAKIK